jgi:hypothetical protein
MTCGQVSQVRHQLTNLSCRGGRWLSIVAVLPAAPNEGGYKCQICRCGWPAVPTNWFFRGGWISVGAAGYRAAPTNYFSEIYESEPKKNTNFLIPRGAPHRSATHRALASRMSRIFSCKKPLHPILTCVYIVFWFPTYYPKPSINWLFEALNEIKWKSYQLQSFLIF